MSDEMIIKSIGFIIAAVLIGAVLMIAASRRAAGKKWRWLVLFDGLVGLFCLIFWW